MYARVLDLESLLKQRSLFLLGARQTGKSTLLRERFPQARFVDLLEADTFRELSARPEFLRQSLSPQERLVVIDEVQKLPTLLDEVHLLIERNKSLRFVLTGSSARKLKRGKANLLAGRAWFCQLHPLVSAETSPEQLDLRLNVGGLPAVLDSSAPHEDLQAYVGTYLAEEIRAEGLTRSIENFSRFLAVAGHTNGQILNFAKVANDSGVPARTVREYYQILQDTLIGHILEPYQKTAKRKAVSTAKFYLFDVGVANTLMQRGKVHPGTGAYGQALEHLVFLELKAYLAYTRQSKLLRFWRSHTKLEVDFLIGDDIAIEVKASPRISPRDFKGLSALSEELNLRRRIVICTEQRARTDDSGVEIMPINTFFRKLWSGEILA